MKRVLITGITGFVGSHLRQRLEKEGGYQIFGTSLTQEETKQNTQILKLNLLDEKSVKEAVNKIHPDYVIHLAALTSPAKSFAKPKEVLENNISAQLNLLEALRDTRGNPRIVIISSADIYGLVDEKYIPVNENTPLNPTNPYSVSKLTQDYLGLQYYHAHNMDIVRARPFNHTGPGQSEDFVVASFAKQIAEIEKEKKKNVVNVGNLKAKRDFTDVRDIVEAYILLMEKGVSGEVYNIGTGKSYKIEYILNKLTEYAKKEINVETDKEKFRPIDVPDLRCDNSKIKKLGWTPTIKIEKTLEDTLDYWRNII